MFELHSYRAIILLSDSRYRYQLRGIHLVLLRRNSRECLFLANMRFAVAAGAGPASLQREPAGAASCAVCAPGTRHELAAPPACT